MESRIVIKCSLNDLIDDDINKAQITSNIKNSLTTLDDIGKEVWRQLMLSSPIKNDIKYHYQRDSILDKTPFDIIIDLKDFSSDSCRVGNPFYHVFTIINGETNHDNTGVFFVHKSQNQTQNGNANDNNRV